MATTVFFEKVISDKENKDVEISLEFGRCSAYRENLIYFSIDGKFVIVDAAIGKEICEAMSNLAAYLSYD